MSLALIEPPQIFKYSLAFLPQGVQMIIPVNPRFFQEAVDLIIGVLPLGAQVVTTNGLSDTPDSSSNPSR
jgi:hypothetical protein